LRKYKNNKVVIDGITFDSIKESEYYIKLLILLNNGIISDLAYQVKFDLIPSQKLENGKRLSPCTYIADFVYIENGKQYVVDVKSEMTRKLPVYSIKKKLMKKKC